MELPDRLAFELAGHGLSPIDVGSKAATLDALIGWRFPVPTSVALTADAYRAFVDGAGLAGFLDELRSGGIPAPQEIEAETALIQQTFRAAPLSDELDQCIRRTVGPLIERGPLAIRSTATAEDLETASFAGQYQSFLDVRTMDEAFETIRGCWASLWLAPARAYRSRQNIPDEGLAMAVLVQALVPAEWSGVLFTRDPEGSSRDMRAEAVAGLGEQLVSGRVTPHDYVIDRERFAVRSPAGYRPLGFLEDLARIGLRIEYYLDAPQDIEWAYSGGKLMILQSRPITVVRPLAVDDDGFNTHLTGSDSFTPRGIAEMLPGVMPPLLWTINAPALTEAFRRLFGALGVSTAGTYRTPVGRFRGRAALNLSVLRDVAAELPGGSVAEVERQYLGRTVTPADDAAGGVVNPGAFLRNWQVRRRIGEEVAIFAGATEAVIAFEADLTSIPAEALVAYRSGLRDLAWRGYAAEVAAASAAAAAYRALEVLLERWVGTADAAEWAQRLTTGTIAEFAVGAARLAAIEALVREHAARDRALLDALRAVAPDQMAAAISGLGESGKEFLGALRRVVRRFGSAAIYAGPTWEEDERAVWQQVAGVASAPERSPAPPADALAELEMMLRRSRRWRLVRAVTGQFIDLRRRLLRKLVDDAITFLRLHERAKNQLLVLGGEERRVVIEMVRRLARVGYDTLPGNEWYLADAELGALFMGEELGLGAEIERRKRACEKYEAAGSLPEMFDDLRDTPAVLDGDRAVLEGWAAGPGVAYGTARVIHGPQEGARLADGDILVAHATDPSWTPLFLAVGGIVLEEGGPLSHAAIVAREFGLPAVLNVPDAVRIIGDGESIEVDGSAGVVRRIEGGEQ